MKLDYTLSLFFMLCYGFISAQEGIWPVEKLPKIQERLTKAGLKLDIRQIYREKEDKAVVKPSSLKMTLGRQKIESPLADSSICLNEAVFDIPSGNAALISRTGLALGVFDYADVPDSLLELLDPVTGVWVSPPSYEYKLPDFFAQNLAYTFDLNEKEINSPINAGVLHKYYSERELVKRHYEEKYDDEDYLYYFSDYYYRPEEKLGVRALSKAFFDVRLLALIEEPLLSKESDQLVAVFRIYVDSLNRPSYLFSKNNRPYTNPHFLPISKNISSDSFHLVMGYPNESYFYFNSLMLNYEKDLTVFNQRFLKELVGTFSTEAIKSFACDCGDISAVDKAIEYHTFVENLFKNQLATEPKWKQDYGELLQLMQENYQKRIKYIPAIIYTDAILNNESNFIQKVDLIKYWQRNQNLASIEPDDYFIEQLTENSSFDLTENEWASLFEFYYTRLPNEHVSPYAKQVLNQHKNDYHQLFNNLIANHPLFDVDGLNKALKQNFYRAMEKSTQNPAQIFLDSIRRYYQLHVENKAMHLSRFTDHYNELFLDALDVVMHYKPLYPDADRSLRVSYGKLAASADTKYWTTNAHLLPSHIGSPAINNKGELLGIVGAFSPENGYNLFNFDVKKSHNSIISIQYILNLLAGHPNGKLLLQEIEK